MTKGYAAVHACGAYVLLEDRCKRIEIVGDILARKAEVHEIELLVIPKDELDFRNYIAREFEVLASTEMEITFLHRGEMVAVTITSARAWATAYRAMAEDAA